MKYFPATEGDYALVFTVDATTEVSKQPFDDFPSVGLSWDAVPLKKVGYKNGHISSVVVDRKYHSKVPKHMSKRLQHQTYPEPGKVKVYFWRIGSQGFVASPPYAGLKNGIDLDVDTPGELAMAILEKGLTDIMPFLAHWAYSGSYEAFEDEEMKQKHPERFG